MHERVVELLVYLMGAMRSQERLAEIDVSRLSSKGYTSMEISTAFSWLFDKLYPTGAETRRTETPPRSLRVLHVVEKSVLTPDGYGFLLQCYEFGLLSAGEVESVIERIMMSGMQEAGLEEVKSVVAAVLFETERPEDGGYPLPGPTDSIH